MASADPGVERGPRLGSGAATHLLSRVDLDRNPTHSQWELRPVPQPKVPELDLTPTGPGGLGSTGGQSPGCLEEGDRSQRNLPPEPPSSPPLPCVCALLLHILHVNYISGHGPQQCPRIQSVCCALRINHILTWVSRDPSLGESQSYILLAVPMTWTSSCPIPAQPALASPPVKWGYKQQWTHGKGLHRLSRDNSGYLVPFTDPLQSLSPQATCLDSTEAGLLSAPEPGSELPDS